MKKACSHLEATAHHRTAPSHPSGHGCVECLKDGGEWVHLRLCLTCGHVGCCDDSPSRHATRHFHASAHPVIKSFEPGEDWAWCFVDEQLLERIPTFPGESPSEHYSAP
ncbi:hypothetical protein D7Y13_12380 [Corallococcus praedator]|uniref:UBP-type domain-containing protein n=1 Tax=Corallococcus praedator TaxID=2316724 RepID=A0ABX9QKH7_9BACT|nr:MULTISPECIES: UBP-type zinc finger domain-containing protein [Corallococcus]RKH18904.1 hypothetical protein D7X74_08345 [Corallococcus sp. CA047B]RKH36043.1 hypothetical protein D7X75_02245 [Corallococcus sp. CA031C]RKI10608.1 hypothetical protein D7Y13_12380 [Corallococcus praedator]